MFFSRYMPRSGIAGLYGISIFGFFGNLYTVLYMATHPVLLPGESHGQRGLAVYSPWGRKNWT